jgi:hypothetical protein
MKRQWKRVTQSVAVATRAKAAFGGFEPAASPHSDSLAGGRRPRFAPNRKRSATDGPFAETKEGLGGSILANCGDQGLVIDVISRIPLTRPEERPMIAVFLNATGSAPPSVLDAAPLRDPKGTLPGRTRGRALVGSRRAQRRYRARLARGGQRWRTDGHPSRHGQAHAV